MNANLIFKWLGDPRFAPGSEPDRLSSFLPVEVERTVIGLPGETAGNCPSTNGLRIELAGGHRLVAEDGFDPERLGRLLKAWLS